MSAKSRLLVVAILSAAALLLVPDLRAGFRSEDYLDFDRYQRVGLFTTLAQPHLDFAQFAFWRPLADGATWLLVNVCGPRPLAIRLVLVALHVAAAMGVAAATRRLLGLSVGAALASALLAVVHPWSASVVTYLDGGVPALLAAIGAFFGLAALGRWRDGEASVRPVVGWTLVAMLSYDTALLLPIVLVAVAWLLPRSERRVPWLLLLLIPLLLVVRHLVVGKAFDSYPVPLVPDALRALLAAFPARLATCAGRLFVPTFPELHGSTTWLRWMLLAVALAGVGVAVVTRRASLATPVRQGLALALLVVGLLGFAPDLFVILPVESKPDELVLAYKSYPAALAAMLLAGWLLGRAAGRRWWGSLALAAPAVAALVVLGRPIARLHLQAQQWASGIPASLIERARTTPKEGPHRFLVREVPVKTQAGARSVTRALQYGLACAVRPLDAYPLFRFWEDSQRHYVSVEAIDALTRAPWLEPVKCVLGEADARVEPIARPPQLPAGTLRLFARPDGVESVLASDLSDAPFVDVGDDGSMELGVSGAASGFLRLFVLNRMHPCMAMELPEWGLSLRRSPGSAPGVDRLAVKGLGWLGEIVRRFPDDLVFVVLEALPDPARTPALPSPINVSNVLPVRLRGLASRR